MEPTVLNESRYDSTLSAAFESVVGDCPNFNVVRLNRIDCIMMCCGNQAFGELKKRINMTGGHFFFLNLKRYLENDLVECIINLFLFGLNCLYLHFLAKRKEREENRVLLPQNRVYFHRLSTSTYSVTQ